MLPGLVCFSFLKIRFGSGFEPTDVIIAIVPRSLIGMAHVCTRFQFIVPIGWQLVHPGPLLPLLFLREFGLRRNWLSARQVIR